MTETDPPAGEDRDAQATEPVSLGTRAVSRARPDDPTHNTLNLAPPFVFSA